MRRTTLADGFNDEFRSRGYEDVFQ